MNFYKFIFILFNFLDCSHKCKFCVSSATNCLECSEINRINDPICDCKDGYFENSLNQCECNKIKNYNY